MRVVIVNQFFWPDIAPTGQYATDLSRHLSAEGHDVTVICSAGSYAQGKYSDEDPRPPVKVIRVPGFAYKRSILARLYSYATFFIGALWHQLRVPKPDLIINMTTPPLLGVTGAIVKMLRGTRLFLWEMDLFPDALVTLGALAPRGIFTQILAWIQDVTRRRSDGVIVLGECMRTRLLARGTPTSLIHVVENWADGTAITPGPNRRSSPLTLLYSGNLGLAHDVDTVTAVLRHFRNDSRFVFTFAGGGVGRAELQRICAAEAIENAHFIPYVDRGRMNEHLAQADIGLVTERPACIGTVVPSKTYSMMAAGRPILFIGPREATPGLVVQRFQCGWQVDPGDVGTLIALLEWSSASRETLWQYGQRARCAFEQHYDMRLGVAKVAAVLGLGTADKAQPHEAISADFPSVERKLV